MAATAAEAKGLESHEPTTEDALGCQQAPREERATGQPQCA